MLSPNEITNDYKTLPEVTQRSSMRSVSHMQMQKPRPMLLLLVSFCLLSYFQRYAKPMFDHIQRETLLSLIFGTLILSLLIILFIFECVISVYHQKIYPRVTSSKLACHQEGGIHMTRFLG